MDQGNIGLLKTRRFLPLFITQFLGAFNDNLFKNALIILITFNLVQAAGHGQMLVTIATGVFILPYFLFSAMAGRLADKFEKQKIIHIIKAAEILIMGVATVAFFTGSIMLLMTVLFLMGVHSTFFGPLKYGILPVHLQTSELLSGNAMIEAGTFLAILLGTIAGGVLILTDHGLLTVSLLALAVAVGGLIASFYIPHAPAAAPGLEVGANIVTDTWELIRYAGSRWPIMLPILAISWFWLIGATFLAQFPAFAKDVLGSDDHVVTLFLTAFSIGIGVGSMLCTRLLRGQISMRYVPVAAIVMTAFILDLYLATRNLSASGEPLQNLSAFLSRPVAWRVLIDLLMLAIASGFYIVPPNTLLQVRSEPSHRARVIAANNIVNAAFMVGGSVLAVLLIAQHFSVPEIFLTFGILNLLVGLSLYLPRTRAAA